MNTMKNALLVTAVAFASLCWAASPTATLLKNRASYNADIATAMKQGKWVANFAKAKKYATDHKVPLVAVWSNGDSCGHCTTFEGAVNSSTFKNYMKSSGVVFYFVYSGDKGNGTTSKSGSKADDGTIASSIFHWCRHNEITAYPFVRTYWPSGKVDVWTDGDKIDKKKSGTTGGKYAVDYFKAKLKKFSPAPAVVTPKYTGASFAVGDTETDRLEAVPGMTTSVELPLARTNTVVSTVSTNLVVISLPGSDTPVTNRIDWAAGDAETNLTVNIPGTMANGERIEIVLLDAAGKGVATSHVTAVATPANSPVNPLWIGEKSADELAWGEWTMDLGVATNKVNAYNAGTGESTSGSGAQLLSAASDKDRAYTLILLEGALWCPDCRKTDEFLFEQDKFKVWAQENKVALVALDLPYGDDTATAPTLLTDKSAFGASGAAYLSRKMIDKDAAADVLDRNFELAQKLRLPNWSNKTRPPVPSLFVLRDDGTVAGRIQYFGGVESPTDASNIDAHIKRLDELLRQVDEPAEEANDNAATTTEVIGLRTNVVDKTISFSDAADVYRLDPETTAGKRLAFALTGTDDVSLQLKVIAGGETVATATGLLSEGVSVGAEVKSTNYCVSVGYATETSRPADARFAVVNAASTLCSYSLATDFVVDPTERAADNHVVIEDGVNEVTVALVSNQLYRITNLDTSHAGNLAALVSTNGPGPADSLYLAQVTGDIRLALSAGESDIQKWNPGTVGFSITSASVLESAGSYTLRVVRSGGVSGTATARLAFNAEKSSAYENLFALPGDFAQELAWAEGETDEKTLNVEITDNEFADGDQSLYFDAATAGDAAPGIVQFRLALRDNDKKVPGKIAITATTPAMAKAMTAFARAGDSVKVELSRVDGTTGEQTVTLAASAGTLDDTTFSWSNRVSAAEETRLALPGSAGKVKVTMTPAKGSFVDGKRRILAVNVLDADVPGFEVDAKEVPATRYVPLAETRIALDDKATDETTVKKYSGSLPSGVKWAFDKDAQEVVFFGVPTQAGTFTAVFRAATGKKEGLTVAVTIRVADPVKTGGGEHGAEPLNASVASTRTFADVPVFDTTTNRLAGVFTLTIPRTGRLSAKYRGVDAGTVTLASKSWSEIGADGTLTAELSGKTADGTPCTMTVRALADGSVEVDFVDPTAPANSFKVLLPGATWSKKNPATDFKGYYTVSLPQKGAVSGTPLAAGAGYVTLKMNTAAAINAGKFAYAGVLPDGRAFSGSAVATPDAWQDASTTSFWSRAVVPVVSLGSLNTLAGALQVTPGAADASATNMVDSGLCAGRCAYKAIRRSVAPAAEADILWRHAEKAAEASYDVLLDAFGTYYVATDNFASCCQTTFQNTTLKFFVQDPDGGDSAAWPADGAPAIAVSYTAKTKANAIKAASNKRGLTLTFTPATGIVSGTFSLDGEKMTYTGVVMPGWGSDDCTECGFSEGRDGGVEAQLRPFISGAAWCGEEFEYVDAKGKEREITVRRGCPFSIGTQSGK